MITHDDSLADSVALLALGVLPESEAQAVAAHVRDCAECRSLYNDLRGAADTIGYAAEATRGELDDLRSARLKSRVMSSIREEIPALTTPSQITTRPATTVRPAQKQDAAQLAALQARAEAGDSVASAARARTRELDARLAELVAPGSKQFAIPGGEVVTSGGHVLIALRHAPVLPAGKVYQAWTLARGAKGVAPSITFAPNANGLTVIELPEASANLAAVAVSVEPTGGSKAPTSTPTFVRKLS
jgi:anti-sigma-K factor RskA